MWPHVKYTPGSFNKASYCKCPIQTCQAYAADQDATDLPVQHRQIGMVFQSYALFKHMTVAENITFGPRIQDMDIDEDER